MRRLAYLIPETRTVLSGALVALGGQLVAYVLGFVSSVVIARAVGAEGRGLYQLPVIAATVCVAVFHLGLENANTVFLAQRGATLARLSRNATVVLALVSPLAMGAMALAFAATRDTVFASVPWSDFLIVVATVPFSLHLLWMANFFLLAKHLAASQVALMVGAALQLGGAAVLYALGTLGVTEVLALYAASVVAAWLLHVLLAREVAPVRPSVDRALLRSVLAFGLKLQLGFVVWFLLLRFDVFLVGAYLGAREVGIYSLAVLFAELAWLVTNPLVQAALPFQAEVSIRESAPLAFKVARFNIALALLFAGAFAAAFWFVIPLLYGSEFSDSYETLVLLLPGVVAMAAARPLSLLLTRQERPLVYSAVACAGLAANVALNVLLLPRVGVVGASVASSVAYVGVTAAWIAWALRASGTSLREAFAPRASDVHTIRDAWRARGLSRAAAAG